MEPKRAILLKRILHSLVVGSAIASLPKLASLTENDTLNEIVAPVLLPGMFAGVAAGGPGMHDISWTATLIGIYIFWICGVYLILRWRAKKAERRARVD